MPSINFEPLIEPAINAAIKMLATHPELLEQAFEAAAAGLTFELQSFIAKIKAQQAAQTAAQAAPKPPKA